MMPCFVITTATLRLSVLVVYVLIDPLSGASQSLPMCQEDESSALLQLKQISPDSNCFDSWKHKENCCAWDRIECNSNNGHVIGLDLRKCGLSTPINSSTISLLFRLSQLESLDLSLNDFMLAPIPYAIGNLSSLKVLKLYGCNLTGQLPNLVNLSRLTMLDLGYNGLTGEIPSSIGELTLLSHLYLRLNRFSGPIPSSLGNLRRLLSLSFNYNQLTGPIPPSLGRLSMLQFLYLGNNQLSGAIPSSIGKLAMLSHLVMCHNQLTGHVPDFLRKLEQLKLLNLTHNNLEGPLPIPPAHIQVYVLSSNRLSGEISTLLCNLSYIEMLDLGNNKLSGFIPKCLSNLSNSLKFLDMHGNNLSGPIPRSHDNCLLKMMDFSRNRLEGLLPRSLANCTALEFLNFGNNMINDTFPSWMGKLSNLTVLLLHNNRFHGKIVKPPNSACGFPKLQIIDISHNHFHGSLPSNYFICWKAMRNSHLRNTDYLAEIFQVVLDKGTPVSQERRYSMSIVNKGKEIEYGAILSYFAAVDLSSNNFSGEIPTSLGILDGLQMLNLSNNILTGRIPRALSNLTQLESLDLSQNMLFGDIPYWLTDLVSLSFFNVSYNRLSGSIPQGRQFGTFQNNSYMGNTGLCGDPLSKKCGVSGEESPPPSQKDDSDDDQYTLFVFDWKIIMSGFACGLVAGVVLGLRVPIRWDN